jgi:hypothetical protein
MRPKRYIAAAALGLSLGLLGSMSPAALAFEETTVGGSDAKSPTAQALELPKDATDSTKGVGEAGKGLSEAGKGLSLTTPELQLSPGTEVRIPGIGTVGVLPKLDFGLELLYGANEQKGPIPDKSGSDDVQLRGTIKHRF